MANKIVMVLAAILIAVAPSAKAAKSVNREIEIENAWVRLYKPNEETTAYFEIVNHGQKADRLLHVSSAAADKATLIRTRWRGMEVYFEPIENLSVPGYGRVRLRPAEYFVRLERPTNPLNVGDQVPLTLTFERSGPIEITARVGNQLLGNR